jgi:hypothetical protein
MVTLPPKDREPTRAEIRQVLVWLIDDLITPEEADEWAVNWILNDDYLDVGDPRVWKLLTQLNGADLQTEPGEYLHGKENFRQWLHEFDEGE